MKRRPVGSIATNNRNSAKKWVRSRGGINGKIVANAAVGMEVVTVMTTEDGAENGFNSRICYLFCYCDNTPPNSAKNWAVFSNTAPKKNPFKT